MDVHCEAAREMKEDVLPASFNSLDPPARSLRFHLFWSLWRRDSLSYNVAGRDDAALCRAPQLTANGFNLGKLRHDPSTHAG